MPSFIGARGARRWGEDRDGGDGEEGMKSRRNLDTEELSLESGGIEGRAGTLYERAHVQLLAAVA